MIKGLLDTESSTGSTPDASVVIVNWNGNQVLPRCLEALITQTVSNFEILIVDNGSKDGSVDQLEIRYPGVHLFCLGENLGFAAANNRGAARARGNWLAFLNNDAFPAPDWIEKLLEAARNYPGFSLFASKLVSAENPGSIDGTGDIYHVSGSAWHRDRDQPVDQSTNQIDEVFSACAAASLVNRQVFLESGGFNERYFSHYEDVDLGFRLRLFGEHCLYVPGAVVYHVGSASFGVESNQTIQNGQRNMVWTYFTNMPGWLFWKYLPAHLLANLIFLTYYTLRGQGKAIWKAKWEAFCGLPKTIQERLKIQASRKANNPSIVSMMDRDWFSPYLLGKRAKIYREWIKQPKRGKLANRD